MADLIFCHLFNVGQISILDAQLILICFSIRYWLRKEVLVGVQQIFIDAN